MSLPIQSNLEIYSYHPRISITDRNKDTLYKADSDNGHIQLLKIFGADVYTREAPPTEIPACLTPAGIKCGNSLASTLDTSKIIAFGDSLEV